MENHINGHLANCAKNSVRCAVYHPDGKCPGYDQYVPCTCQISVQNGYKLVEGEFINKLYKDHLDAFAGKVNEQSAIKIKQPWEERFEQKFDVPVYMQEMMVEMRMGDADWKSMKDFIRSVREEAYGQGMKEHSMLERQAVEQAKIRERERITGEFLSFAVPYTAESKGKEKDYWTISKQEFNKVIRYF